MNRNFDVIIIGSGPGGYVAAIRSAQLGFKTAIVEKANLGGTCLNWGCIPTKALLRSAEVYSLIKNSKEFGIECSNVKFDIKKIVSRSREVSKKLSDGVKYLLNKNKVEVLYGHGSLLNNRQLKINDENIILNSEHIIIATGTRARILPHIPVDHKIVWDYKDAMLPEELPESILIVGGGFIGIEYASFYNSLGVKVTVIEVGEKILASADHDIIEFATKEFKSHGIEIHTSTQVKSIKILKNSAEVELLYKNGSNEKRNFGRIISAVGTVPNVENIGLENTKGVTFSRNGHIEIDEYMRTGEKGVYAIGDVTTIPFLAHKASHQGLICIDKIAGLHNVHTIDKNNIPGCVYCKPQIASVGYTENDALKAGYKINVGQFPLIGNGKAIAFGDTSGFIKTIFNEETGEILGVHMIGPEVTEMIHSIVLAKTAECTEQEMMHTIFPHPTISEAIHESVLAAFNRAIHI